MSRAVTARLVGLVVMSVVATTVVARAQTAAQRPLTFLADIQPIMARSCWSCHGADRESGLDLRTRAGALEGGIMGPAIVPGRSDASPLYRRIAGLDEPAMPMDGTTLLPAEIAAIRTWIDQGAHWDAGPATNLAQPAAADAGSGVTPVAASEYWAFKLPVQVPVPAFPEFVHRPVL